MGSQGNSQAAEQAFYDAWMQDCRTKRKDADRDTRTIDQASGFNGLEALMDSMYPEYRPKGSAVLRGMRWCCWSYSRCAAAGCVALKAKGTPWPPGHGLAGAIARSLYGINFQNRYFVSFSEEFQWNCLKPWKWLKSRRVLKKAKRGEYLLKESVQGYVDFLSDSNTAIDADLAKELLQERVKKTKQERIRLEIENRRIAGDLLEKIPLQENILTMLSTLKGTTKKWMRKQHEQFPDLTHEFIDKQQKELTDHFNKMAEMGLGNKD